MKSKKTQKIWLSRDKDGATQLWASQPELNRDRRYGANDDYFVSGPKGDYGEEIGNCRKLFGRLPRPGQCIELIISEPKGATPVKELLDILLPIIALLESSGDPNAINVSENALGILQITPICVKDVRRLGLDVTHDQCFDPQVSRLIFDFYLRHYGANYELNEKSVNSLELGSPEFLDALVILARIWQGGPPGPTLNDTASRGHRVRELAKEYFDAQKLEKIRCTYFGIFCHSFCGSARSELCDVQDEPGDRSNDSESCVDGAE